MLKYLLTKASKHPLMKNVVSTYYQWNLVIQLLQNIASWIPYLHKDIIYIYMCVCVRACVRIGLPQWLSGKEFTCNSEATGLIPESGRSLEEGMATHSSILAWRIPWTEEPGRLQSMGLQRVGHN